MAINECSEDAPRGERITERLFPSGYCGAFAVVLHNRHPWPLGLFVLRNESDYPDEDWRTVIAHAVALPAEGIVADVKGIRAEEDIYPDLRYSNEPDEIALEEMVPEQELINRMLISLDEIDLAKQGYRKFRDRFP